MGIKMIEKLSDLGLKELDRADEKLEDNLDVLLQEKLGLSLSKLKESLAVFLNERAEEFALDLPNISPYNDYTKLIESYDGMVNFLKSDVTKPETWHIVAIAEDSKNKNLLKFEFKSTAVDDGESIEGLVFVSKSGVIRHSFVQSTL